jgi:3-oxoacid CoA-transferase subunit B
VVDRIIPELAVLDITEQGMKLIELAPGVTFEQVQEATGCRVITA